MLHRIIDSFVILEISVNQTAEKPTTDSTIFCLIIKQIIIVGDKVFQSVTMQRTEDKILFLF